MAETVGEALPTEERYSSAPKVQAVVILQDFSHPAIESEIDASFSTQNRIIRALTAKSRSNWLSQLLLPAQPHTLFSDLQVFLGVHTWLEGWIQMSASHLLLNTY